MSKAVLFLHMQDEGHVEPFNPRWFLKAEITQAEYEDEEGIEHQITLDEIKKFPHKTPAQKKKWTQAILEYYNQEAEDEDDRSDKDYITGKRDGYSACLNDLFGTGNAS